LIIFENSIFWNSFLNHLEFVFFESAFDPIVKNVEKSFFWSIFQRIEKSTFLIHFWNIYWIIFEKSHFWNLFLCENDFVKCNHFLIHFQITYGSFLLFFFEIFFDPFVKIEFSFFCRNQFSRWNNFWSKSKIKVPSFWLRFFATFWSICDKNHEINF